MRPFLLQNLFHVLSMSLRRSDNFATVTDLHQRKIEFVDVGLFATQCCFIRRDLNSDADNEIANT